MTDQEQNIAIAECCGIKPRKIQTGNITYYLDDSGWHILPNYVGSFDAMAMAEEKLEDAELKTYDTVLKQVMTSGCRVCDFSLYAGDFIWHASSRQRAEAFLRTKGLWKE
jgi:hypothetical protein